MAILHQDQGAMPCAPTDIPHPLGNCYIIYLSCIQISTLGVTILPLRGRDTYATGTRKTRLRWKTGLIRID